MRKRKTKERQREEEGEAKGGGDTGLGASHTSASRDLGILRQDILFSGPTSRARRRITRFPSAHSRVLGSASDHLKGAERGLGMTPCPRNFIPGRRILLEGARFLAQDACLHENTKDPRRRPGQIPEVAGLFSFSLLFYLRFLSVPLCMDAWVFRFVFFFFKDSK